MINKTESDAVLRSVAIIGSGLAGLTAAILLKSRGYEATVFEKSRGPGGRLASKRVKDGSADVGAQYFTIRNPEFQQFLDEYAGPETYAPWNGHFGYQKAAGHFEAFPDDQRYVGVPRMTSISRALSASVNLTAETRIAKLKRKSSGWSLVSTENQIFGPFDAVIITAPPAQARELLADSELTQLAAELDQPVAHMQPCWAVAAHFPQSPLDRLDGIRANSDILSWAGNNSSKPGRSDDGEWWVLHGTSEWSQANVDTPAEQVSVEIIRAFQSVTGNHLWPDSHVTHRWLYARSTDPETPGNRWFSADCIGLAGDWLSGGRVEGAFDSASGLVDVMTARPARQGD